MFTNMRANSSEVRPWRGGLRFLSDGSGSFGRTANSGNKVDGGVQ